MNFKLLVRMLCAAWVISGSLSPTMVQGAPGKIEPAGILRVRIQKGAFKDAFRLMDNDARLNWYFCNLGLLPFIESSSRLGRSE